ncbi:MAG: phosphotransferase [Streptosporangiales bacterium]|nr:phosphotransferase [Streptosporangiales bacterium]
MRLPCMRPANRCRGSTTTAPCGRSSPRGAVQGQRMSSSTGSPSLLRRTSMRPTSRDRARPAELAALATACPGLRIERVLRRTGKSLLATGRLDEQPVVVKALLDPDPFWRTKWHHEIGVYRTFAEHPPPVRVPQLIHTDGDQILVLERLGGAPLCTDRYPRQGIGHRDIDLALGALQALSRWEPPADRFAPIFNYPDRIARYHARGYFDDTDSRALDQLLDRCDQAWQLNHGDPLPDNLLLTADGDCALLDWEFTGLFLPGFDLAMLHTLLAAVPGARDRIDALLPKNGHVEPFLVNLAMVLSRELRIHHELPNDSPLRRARLLLIEDAWADARDRIHSAARRS